MWRSLTILALLVATNFLDNKQRFAVGVVVYAVIASAAQQQKQKHKRVILVGPAGSGKDYLRDILGKVRGFHLDVSVTTRPPRQGEIDGYTYKFITEDDFEKIRREGGFKETARFAGNNYGTLRDNWNRCNVFIMSPAGLKCLTKKERDESFVVYLCPSEIVRRKRLSQRPDFDAAKIEQRTKDDHAAFNSFVDYDVMDTNEAFTAQFYVPYLRSRLT